MRTSVNYDVSGGVVLHVRGFIGGFEVVDDEIRVEPNEYPAFTSEDDPVLRRTWHELYEKTYKVGSHTVHAAVLNRETETDEVTVIGMNWGGHFQHPLAHRELAYTVRTNPDRRFLVFDHLGVGSSEPLPRSAAKELAKSGRFTEYGSIILSGIKSILKDFDRVHFEGNSLGGLAVMEIASQHDEPAGNVLVYDAPGSLPLGFMGVYKAFVTKERKHAQRYLAESLDEASAIEQARVNSSVNFLRMTGSLLARGRLLTQFVRMPQALGHERLGEAVEATLPNVAGRFTFLSPEFSELNSVEAVRRILQSVAESDARHPGTELRHVTFNGTHAFAQGSPSVVAAVKRQATE